MHSSTRTSSTDGERQGWHWTAEKMEYTPAMVPNRTIRPIYQDDDVCFSMIGKTSGPHQRKSE